MALSDVYSWGSASRWLERARWPERGRTVGYNTDVRYIDCDRCRSLPNRPPNRCIALRHHATDIIIYHVDDFITVRVYRSVSTMRRYRECLPADIPMWTQRYEGESTLMVFHRDDPKSKPRVWKCRACWGRGGQEHPVYCFGTREATPDCPSPVHDEGGGWGRGHQTGETYWAVCYRCNGDKTVDYGSKQMGTIVEHGDLFLLNPDRKVVALWDSAVSGGWFKGYPLFLVDEVLHSAAPVRAGARAPARMSSALHRHRVLVDQYGVVRAHVARTTPEPDRAVDSYYEQRNHHRAVSPDAGGGMTLAELLGLDDELAEADRRMAEMEEEVTTNG